MSEELLAGRAVPEVYRVQGRKDLHAFLMGAVEASGGRVLYASDADRAPIYLGVQLNSDERLGILVYPFRITRNVIKNRPADEVRGQLRYGGERSWDRDHPVGRDIAGIDVTVVLGVDPEDGVILGLDATVWDPLPMGISFYAKQAEVDQAKKTGWHVWEKTNRSGPKRSAPRSLTSLETVVGFTPDRFIDFVRLERQATSLGLDPALRHAAAFAFSPGTERDASRGLHTLEKQFDLTSKQILDIIGDRNRLSVAVRGGVAEFHLEQLFRAATDVQSVERLDVDAMHDFNVTLADGRAMRVECKNASPKVDANGHFRVEVQKTRASKGDPASRFYPVDGFDIVAACLFSPTARWDFRYIRTDRLERHKNFPDRLAPVQKIDERWSRSLAEVGDPLGSQ